MIRAGGATDRHECRQRESEDRQIASMSTPTRRLGVALVDIVAPGETRRIVTGTITATVNGSMATATR
jgi:hypothetical protein